MPPAARRSALDQGTGLGRAGPVEMVGGKSVVVVGAVPLPRRRFRGLTARPRSRKGPARAEPCGMGKRAGPCARTSVPSEATPRRRGRVTEALADKSRTRRGQLGVDRPAAAMTLAVSLKVRCSTIKPSGPKVQRCISLSWYRLPVGEFRRWKHLLRRVR